MLPLWIVLGVIALVVLYAIYTYNRLVRLRVNVDNAWSQIDVQLRRRYDLIPNLVEAVKGYAGHEREVFEQVTRARSQAQEASGVRVLPDDDLLQRQDGESLLVRADTTALDELVAGLVRAGLGVRQLLAVAENYPDLKANQNFLALQEELTGTESKIAYARQFYNDEVASLNTRIQAFPSSIVARMGHFTSREFFEIEEPARGPVEVQF